MEALGVRHSRCKTAISRGARTSRRWTRTACSSTGARDVTSRPRRRRSSRDAVNAPVQAPRRRGERSSRRPSTAACCTCAVTIRWTRRSRTPTPPTSAAAPSASRSRPSSRIRCEAEPLNESDGAQLGAELTNAWVAQRAPCLLADHEVNRAREARGRPPANIVLVRDAGDQHPGRRVVARPIRHALRVLRRDARRDRDLEGHRDGADPRHVTDRPGGLFGSSPERALEALDDYDAMYVHLKGPDVPAHDGRAYDKRDVDRRHRRRVLRHAAPGDRPHRRPRRDGRPLDVVRPQGAHGRSRAAGRLRGGRHVRRRPARSPRPTPRRAGSDHLQGTEILPMLVEHRHAAEAARTLVAWSAMINHRCSSASTSSRPCCWCSSSCCTRDAGPASRTCSAAEAAVWARPARSRRISTASRSRAAIVFGLTTILLGLRLLTSRLRAGRTPPSGSLRSRSAWPHWRPRARRRSPSRRHRRRRRARPRGLRLGYAHGAADARSRSARAVGRPRRATSCVRCSRRSSRLDAQPASAGRSSSRRGRAPTDFSSIRSPSR